MSEPWLPTEHGTDNRGLRGRVTRGLSWTIVDQWGRQALNLLVFAVIAHLVTPEDIGLVALATVFVALAQIFVDAGLADALVQRRELTRAHIDTAFWASMASAVVLALAGIVLAIPLGVVFGQPELTPILQVLSLTFVLFAFSATQMALLRRELAFRSLALRALFAIGGGSIVGIALAILGWGAWALVGQQVAQATLSVVALWRVSPWRPSRNFSRAHFRELFSFGINVVGSDILGFLSRRTDNLLIAFFIGSAALGLYTVAYRILESTSALLIGIATKIAFPAFSRLQGDRERMRRAFLRVTRISSAVILPGFVGLSLIAPEMTVLLFGPDWAESGPVASVLFMVGIAYSVTTFGGSLLNAAGHPEVVFRFRLITTVTNVVGFAIAVPFGILAVAAAFVLRSYLLLPLHLYWMQKYAGVPIGTYLGRLTGVAAASAAMAIVVIGVKVGLAGSVGPLVLLAVEVVAGALAFVLAMWALDRSVLVDVLTLARDALPGRRRDRAVPQSRCAEPALERDGGPIVEERADAVVAAPRLDDV